MIFFIWSPSSFLPLLFYCLLVPSSFFVPLFPLLGPFCSLFGCCCLPSSVFCLGQSSYSGVMDYLSQNRCIHQIYGFDRIRFPNCSFSFLCLCLLVSSQGLCTIYLLAWGFVTINFFFRVRFLLGFLPLTPFTTF